MNPREHIEMIQQETVGSDRVRESLNNSIEELGIKLNTKKIHFIFELIQNAEDNKYDESSDPSLTFHLLSTNPTNTPNSNGTLFIENNEVGFSEENVDAICSVGKSTKKKIEGYIGEKGIGFKSVFKVSSLPHIFSNGYEFNLPKHDESSGFGFIYPIWVDSIPDILFSSETTIVLPLNRNDYPFENMERDLCDIKSETILFLSKLKKLKIIIDKHYERTIYKDDSQYPIVKVWTETYDSNSNLKQKFVEKYWVHTESFPVPEWAYNEERVDIQNRPVTVAFPLSPVSKSAGQIFAYLPIQSDSGLPFLVNADFLLTADREKIEDNQWNKWLRDCVADVFVNAFELIIDNEEYRMGIYQFIPLDANNDFLRPIVESIQEKLQDRKIILAQPDLEKCLPEDAMTAPKLFRSLITKPYPSHLLNTRLVHPELEKFKEQLDTIGIDYFASTDFIKCLNDKEWIKHHSQNLEWLVELYKYIRSRQVSKEELKDCPIILVRDKDSDSSYLSCASKQAIYFEDAGADMGDVLSKTPSCVELNLAFLDDNFCNIVDDNLEGWMTKYLEIYPFSAENYAIDVIDWLNTNFTEMDDDDLVSVTYFIAQFADVEDSEIDIPVLLDNGSRKLLSDIKKSDIFQEVVTPACLNTENGWQNIFVSGEDRGHLAILSDKYMQNSINNIDLLKLWDNLEITAYPLPKRTNKKCSSDDSLTAYEKYLTNEVKPLSAKTHLPKMMICNCITPSTICNSESIDADDRKAFSQSMIHWLKKYMDNLAIWMSNKLCECGLNARVEYWKNGPKCEYFDSPFLNGLKSNPWLFTTKGFVKPSDAFIPDNNIKSIFEDSIPYVDDDIPDDVVKILGIRKEPTVDKILDVISNHAEVNSDSKDFASHVYKYLNIVNDHQQIISRFENENLIYVHSHKDKWFSSKNVIWSDKSNVLDDDFAYLEKIYPKLEDFFVGILGVKKDVDTRHYAERWLTLQTRENLTPDEIKNVLTSIYHELLPICKKEDHDRPDWWAGFVKNAQIWTQNDSFVRPEDVYVPDDVDLKHIFNGGGIHFAWRPEKDTFSQWESLYRAFDLKYLSGSVKTSLVNQAKDLVIDDPQYLTEASKVLITTWLAGNKQNDYERLQKNDLLNSLLSTKEAVLKSICVVYQLGYIKVEKERDAYWVRDDGTLVLSQGPVQGMFKNKIALTIARALMPNRAYKDFANWIELVLCETDFEWRVKQNNWSVPVDVQAWLNASTQSSNQNKPSWQKMSEEIDHPIPSDDMMEVSYEEVANIDDELHDTQPEAINVFPSSETNVPDDKSIENDTQKTGNHVKENKIKPPIDVSDFDINRGGHTKIMGSDEGEGIVPNSSMRAEHTTDRRHNTIDKNMSEERGHIMSSGDMVEISSEEVANTDNELHDNHLEGVGVSPSSETNVSDDTLPSIESDTQETDNHVEGEKTKAPIGVSDFNIHRGSHEKIINPPLDSGAVKNPSVAGGRILEMHRNNHNAEPQSDARRRTTERTILEGPDENVREHLKHLYGGKCQICGKTFPEGRTGEPFFIANYIVERKKARSCDTFENALCLCADHFAKWQHGKLDAEILDQIMALQAENTNDDLFVKIKLCGEECEIGYRPKHIFAMQKFIESLG